MNVKADISKYYCIPVTTEKLGGGAMTATTTRNALGQFTSLKTMKGNTQIHNMNFVFDPSTGNLTSRTGMTSQQETFEYDNLDRLTTAGNMTMTYAANGNITDKTGLGAYNYSNFKPHVVEYIDDPDGLINNRTQTIEYNALNKASVLIDTVGNDAYRLEITCGSDGQRWKTALQKNDNITKTAIFAGDYEKIIENGVTKELIYLPGGGIYVKQAGQADKIYYTHTDHLGSIVSITAGAGAEVFKASYDAWGKQTVTLNTIGFHRGYTGHEHLPEFGLINMNGRMYDPTIGRFLSPDPFVQAPEFSQSFNRYSYVRNNPMIYTDPTGENPLLIAAIITGAYLGGSSANNNFNPAKWDWKDIKTYGGIVVGGISGWTGASVGAGIAASAVAGGSGTIGAGIAGSMMGGMASGGINGFGMSLVMGGNLNDALGNGIQGAVMGGFSGALSGGVGAAIGDFTGVAGNSFKNGMYELGHSALKGATTGFAGGAMMATMTQDASYLWKGALSGVAFNTGMAGLRIAALGTAFIPDPEIYCELPNYGQVYRRGSIFMPSGTGITLGRSAVVKFTGDTDYDRYLLHHETGHLSQINEMGMLKFYGRTGKEYISHTFSGLGWYSVYTTPGTLEYNAVYRSSLTLGYYFYMGKIDKWIKIRIFTTYLLAWLVVCNLSSCLSFISNKGYMGICTNRQDNYCYVDTSVNLWYVVEPSLTKISGDSLLFEIMLTTSPLMLIDSFKMNCLYDNEYLKGCLVSKDTDKSHSYWQFIWIKRNFKNFMRSHILIVEPVIIRNGEPEQLPLNEFKWLTK